MESRSKFSNCAPYDRWHRPGTNLVAVHRIPICLTSPWGDDDHTWIQYSSWERSDDVHAGMKTSGIRWENVLFNKANKLGAFETAFATWAGAWTLLSAITQKTEAFWTWARSDVILPLSGMISFWDAPGLRWRWRIYSHSISYARFRSTAMSNKEHQTRYQCIRTGKLTSHHPQTNKTLALWMWRGH